MKIGSLSHHQSLDPGRVTPPMTKKQDDDQSPKTSEDRVDISGNGRELLADMADKLRREQLTMNGGQAELDVMAADESSSLENGRLEQIRLKILSGYYNSPKVIDAIADRLTDDLDD
ncbi:hypothetical protein KQH51_01455 [bacterium]|nr:hypothetical protein [bacterium]MCB2201591.1 hypothetical protein [bacterium]